MAEDEIITYQFRFSPGGRNDDLRKSLIDLASEHGWPAVARECCSLTAEWSEKRKPGKGRKPKWRKDRILHVWLAVELERIRSNGKRISVTLEQLFRRKKGPWLIYVGDGWDGIEMYEIKTAETARRLHSEANRLMKSNRGLAAKWKHNLELALSMPYRINVTDRRLRSAPLNLREN